MGVDAPPSAFSDADLNGLVDGHLEAGRQADLVHRLKSNGFERARVAAWREQTELLKASFSEIEREPIPLSLGLTPPPRLKCITSERWSGGSVAPLGFAPLPARAAPRSRHRTIGLAMITGCFGIAGVLLLVTGHPVSMETPDLVLASTDGLLVTPNFETVPGPAGKTSPETGKPKRPIRDLPTKTIPDLGEAGFSFTGATVRGGEPSALIFSYDSDAAEHLVLSVSKAGGRVQHVFSGIGRA